MSGLYIHIPYCMRKCDYCAFYSVPKPWGNEELFLSKLQNELSSLPNSFFPETIFIGGGTPSALDMGSLKKLLSLLNKFSASEFSIEVNPSSISEEKLTLLIASGVNRLSVGVQSFNEKSLETLGRIQTIERAIDVVCLARGVGFKNISADLIFGIPGQTIEMLEDDLTRMISLDSEHISIYNLMFEEGTPLSKRNEIRLNEELEREMYDHIRSRLKDAGFVHYEISNFAKPGCECQHNMLYWTGGEYFGCGPAAHSHWNGKRWANVADLDSYCSDGPKKEFEETLDKVAKKRETLVMNLRLLSGVDVNNELFEELAGDFSRLEELGLLEIKGRRVRLTDDALFVSDSVFAELI